jgi:Sulfotransferase domain
LNKKKYIIIGGVNKAGTTSLYTWLAAHPNVCAAFVKQTFFFLDKEWQKSFGLESIYDYEKGFDEFDNYFTDCNGRPNKLEASPEYLYAPGTPGRLKQFLNEKEGYVIFILRNPVQRFISLYYYGKQQAIIPQNINFETFLEQSKSYTANKNTSLNAFETGFYTKYIERYLQVLKKEKLKVYFFEEMIAGEKEFIKKLCADIGIDPAFYDSFGFEAQHKTVKIRSAFLAKLYLVPRELYIKLFYRSKAGLVFARLLKKIITKQYRKLNITTLEQEILPESALNFLKNAYKHEKANLENLLDVEVPW